MKYILFLALLSWAAIWLYLWRYAWTGEASKKKAVPQILKTMLGSAIIVSLPILWGMLMAHGMEKQYEEMDEKAAIMSNEINITDSIIVTDTIIAPSSIRAVCTYYSWPEHGHKTASGEIYDSLSYTCATLEKIPFGTMLKFINQNNGRQVVCRVNDRMPTKYWETDRRFDLSKAAAESLGIVREGIKVLLVERLL